MDGGRVLRALLALRFDYLRATQIAVIVAQVLAFGLALLGFFANPFFVFIALLVWVFAAEEASMVEVKVALRDIPISRTMITDFRTLAPEDPLARAVDYVVGGFQEDFPVVVAGQVVGVLTLMDLLIALAQHGKEVAVRDVMQNEFETVDALETAESVFGRLHRDARCRTVPVLQHGRLVGIATMDNVNEFVAIQAAVRRPRERSVGTSPTGAGALEVGDGA